MKYTLNISVVFIESILTLIIDFTSSRDECLRPNIKSQEVKRYDQTYLYII